MWTRRSGENLDLDMASQALFTGIDLESLSLKCASKRLTFLSKHFKEASRMFNMDGKLMPAPMSARRRAKEQAELEAEGFGNADEERNEDEEEEGGALGLMAALPSPVVPAVPADEKWVQCDKCSKWRRLPPDVDVNKLPARWYCSMNKRRPEYASCEAAEEAYADPVRVRTSRSVTTYSQHLNSRPSGARLLSTGLFYVFMRADRSGPPRDAGQAADPYLGQAVRGG